MTEAAAASKLVRASEYLVRTYPFGTADDALAIGTLLSLSYWVRPIGGRRMITGLWAKTGEQIAA